MDKVSIVKCADYADSYAAVKKSLDLIGGIEKYVKPGSRVVLKPNFVSRRKPEAAVTTHPAVLRAVIELAESAGGKVTIAESPGGPYNAAYLKSVYSACGALEAADGTGAEINYDTAFEEVPCPDGATVKKLPIIKPILDADVIISLPKLKTHSMTSYSGAVKNLYGTVPGTYKAELHFRLDERKTFCSMLIDLCETVKPTLAVMDGVWGMEGDGPTNGERRDAGVIMAAANLHALDYIACKMIGYDLGDVDTISEAANRGLFDPNAIEVTGDDPNSFGLGDFVKPQTDFNLLKVVSLPPRLNKLVVKMLASRPAIDEGKCVGCGECARCCPPKAISMESGKPDIDRKTCIKCFCCQELCPKGAVKIKRPLLNRFMLKFLK